MNEHRTYRIAAILVGAAALLIVLERLWNLALIFQDIILLFALAWLISFTFAPLVEWLKRPYFAERIYRRFRPRIRALALHLTANQSDAEFDTALDGYIQSIYEASLT